MFQFMVLQLRLSAPCLLFTSWCYNSVLSTETTTLWCYSTVFLLHAHSLSLSGVAIVYSQPKPQPSGGFTITLSYTPIPLLPFSYTFIPCSSRCHNSVVLIVHTLITPCSLRSPPLYSQLLQYGFPTSPPSCHSLV